MAGPPAPAAELPPMAWLPMKLVLVTVSELKKASTTAPP